MAEGPAILAQGADGLVVRFADRLSDGANRAALAFRAAVEAERLDGVAETSPALASVYLRMGAEADPEAVRARIEALAASRDWHGAPLPAERRRWTIPALFGGERAPALAAAAEQAGMSPEAAVADLTARPVRVLAVGFAPGQPYLGELSEQWDLPRLGDLVDVPAAALVLAIRQLVLFANPSPTGWQHVAQTAFRCFRPDEEDPFPLRPGDEVSFRSVDKGTFAALEDDPSGGATCEPAA